MNLLLEYVQLQNYESRDEPFYKNNIFPRKYKRKPHNL